MVKKIFAGKSGKVQGPKMLSKGKNRGRDTDRERERLGKCGVAETPCFKVFNSYIHI